MAMVATDIKGMLSISIKSRHDSHTDQYNRIFMVKIFLACSLVMGISWFQDSINCVVPDMNRINAGFVSSACWIQGVYVYRELLEESNAVAYYGIPKDVTFDGLLQNQKDGTHRLCVTNPKLDSQKNPNCEEMHKTFFLQYQWMPFLIASLAVVFYLPYIAFRSANTDIISLKESIKKENPDAELIAKHYFNRRVNPPRTLMFRTIFNLIIKVTYLMANLVALLGLDALLNKKFISYGKKWISWSNMNNTAAFDYMGFRDSPKPGNEMLPPFGYCELYEAAADAITTLGNKHKFVCELSQNILYQYCLIVIWFAVIIGIVLSILGIVLMVVHYAIGIFGIKTSGPCGKKLYNALCFRELEYLEFIRKRDAILYGEVLEKLKETILGPNAPMDNRYAQTDRTGENAPLYPSLPPKENPYDEKY